MTDTLALEGRLTVREVPELFRQLDQGLPARLDLSAVTQADSSALALLLECRARAMASGKPLDITHPPENLRVIARLTEVADLLGWNEQEPEGEHAE